MRLHYFQHVPFEDLGSIKDWALNKNMEITSTRFYKGETPPEPEEYDWLVVMGGPMGIYDYELYPWLKSEKRAIRKAIKDNKTILGICLGAQLISDVLGSQVTQNPEKEIGWFPIIKNEKADQSPIAAFLPQETIAFHWHGDTFPIPEGAVPLASSEACKNQGFIYNDRIVGLQFHLESIPKSVQLLIDNCRNELVKAPFIQSVKTLQTDEYFPHINAIMESLLEKLYANITIDVQESPNTRE